MDTWVMLEKNQTIYKYKLHDNQHLFNKDVMNLQIEGWNPDVPMDYNDIICIKTHDYLKSEIEEMPTSLKEFHAKDTKLRKIPTFTENIQTIQIINSKIDFTEEKRAELKQLYPKASIHISYFAFMESTYKKTGETEHFLRDIRRDIERNNAPLMDTLRNNGDLMETLQNPHRHNRNVLDSDQTVHITSINKCVIDAIVIIKTESKKYPRVLNPIQCLLFKNKKKDEEIPEDHIIDPSWLEIIKNYFYSTGQKSKHVLGNAIQGWLADEQKHTVHSVTFRDLFIMIMTIVENHEKKADLKERLITELTDSMGMCFTGRINRMVNSLVGFVEGIHVGISVKEEIQMKISMIIRKLMEKKIDKEEATKRMEELFRNVGEEENITENYKEANLQALEEFVEEEDNDHGSDNSLEGEEE